MASIACRSGADAFLLAGWLGLAGVLMLGLYLGAAALLRVPELREATSLLRRRRAAKLP